MFTIHTIINPFHNVNPENTHAHITVLLLIWNLSGTTQVSRYQKGKTRKVKSLKPISIYWSKR